MNNFSAREKKKKVIVGMSGGVDSTMAAALLKKKGYEVRGVFMRLWHHADNLGDLESNAEKDAKKVAKILAVPIKIIDVRKKFKKEVVDYFLSEYARGRTPNPCVFCNKNLKFKILFEEMVKAKADYVATGHYAKIMEHARLSGRQGKRSIKQKIYKLFEAEDKNKDQSYFLYRLGQGDLSRIIFPLGEYKKGEVKEMAKKRKLPVWEKRESQDVCFLANTNPSDFLIENLKLKKGKIFAVSGEVIGKHAGLPLYTLGQRKGINIGGTGPYYVVAKNFKKNKLIVADSHQNSLLFSSLAGLEKINWISKKPDFPARVSVRTRYRDPLVYATISRETGAKGKKREYKIKFDKSQRAVTPGQSTVFYASNGEVLGGGIIK